MKKSPPPPSAEASGAVGEDLIVAHLEWRRHNQGRAAATIDKYHRFLEQLVAFAGERGTPVLELGHVALEEFVGPLAHQAGLTPRARRPLVAAVRGFFAWAHRSGLVGANPAVWLQYPASGRRLPDAMSLESAGKLIMAPGMDTFLGVRDTAILSVLLGCGLRLSGVARLNESDLLWAQQDGVEWLVIRAREKGDHERLVPAPHETWGLVRAYLGHPELETIDRALPDGDQVLWASTMNRQVPEHRYHGEERRLSRRCIQQLLQRYGQRAGIPKRELHPHALRHLYGTELAEDGTDVLRIQALMGHANPKTSAEYVRLAVRTLSGTVAKSSPITKVKTPVTGLLPALKRAR